MRGSIGERHHRLRRDVLDDDSLDLQNLFLAEQAMRPHLDWSLERFLCPASTLSRFFFAQHGHHVGSSLGRFEKISSRPRSTSPRFGGFRIGREINIGLADRENPRSAANTEETKKTNARKTRSDRPIAFL